MKVRGLLVLAVLALAAPAAAQTETIEYYGTDAIGSVRVVFDASGAILARQDYTPFGQPLMSAPAQPPEGFGGQSTDDEAQQAYFHARQFEARLGRFATIDAVFDGVFDPQRWNRYAYAANRPLVLVDSEGLNAMFTGTSTPGCEEFNCDVPLQMDLWWYGLDLGGGGNWSDDADPVGGGEAGADAGNGETSSGSSTPPQDPPPTNPNPPGPPPPRDCPAVPVSPPNVSLPRNILEARMAATALGDGKIRWFYGKVRNARGRLGDVLSGQSWDYKQLDRKYGDFTNFNYGATGASAGIPWLELATASGFAHFVSHRFEGLWPSELLNEAGDQVQLWKGFRYTKNGCS